MIEWFQTYGAMVSTVALIVTLCVLIWYTIETSRLRKTTVKQTKLQLRPCITATFEKGERNQLFIKNVGHSPAFNIEFKPLKIGDIEYRFSSPSALEQKYNSRLWFQIIGVEEEGEKSNNWGVALTKIQAEQFELEISYQNFEKQCFASKVRVDKNKEQIEFLKTWEC